MESNNTYSVRTTHNTKFKTYPFKGTTTEFNADEARARAYYQSKPTLGGKAHNFSNSTSSVLLYPSTLEHTVIEITHVFNHSFKSSTEDIFIENLTYKNKKRESFVPPSIYEFSILPPRVR